MRIIQLFLVITLLAASCEESEKIEERIEPLRVWTLPPERIDNTTLLLRANVSEDTTVQLIDCGFNWYKVEKIPYGYIPVGDPIKIDAELDENIPITAFKSQIDSLWLVDSLYMVQAFINTNARTILGNEVIFSVTETN